MTTTKSILLPVLGVAVDEAGRPPPERSNYTLSNEIVYRAFRFKSFKEVAIFLNKPTYWHVQFWLDDQMIVPRRHHCPRSLPDSSLIIKSCQNSIYEKIRKKTVSYCSVFCSAALLFSRPWLLFEHHEIVKN